MPRYYFDILHRGNKATDEEGTVCEDLETAKHEAKLSTRDLASEEIQSGTLDTETCVEVRDEAGTVLASLTIAEVLRHPNTPEFGNGCE